MKNTTTSQTSETSPEVLKYQLASVKRDSRKNIIIATLVTLLVAFILGYMVSAFQNGPNGNQVNALQSQINENTNQLKVLQSAQEQK